MSTEPIRHFPVRPNLVQLKHQAKDFLKALRSEEPAAVNEFSQLRRTPLDPSMAKLIDAQYVLARSYGLASWPRLVLACRMTNAIWDDDAATVHELIAAHPKLLKESARGFSDNWGAPLSYAATVGRNDIIQLLRDLGADDLQFAFERACLKGHIEIARSLFDMGARPMAGSVMGPCETLNGEGLEFQLKLGAALTDEKGNPLAPVGLILQTYSRNPEGKHRCLDLVRTHGTELPDTPPMAIHRGRIDLLETHLKQDPDLFTRTYPHTQIFPIELGCSEDPTYALCGAPLGGTTLLHMCMDYDEYDLARWILDQGGPVDVPARIDAEGFGGHTALFACVVSQPYRVGRGQPERLTRLLLDHGADVNARASIRKALRFVEDETLHVYRDVTPRALGERFHDQDWVNKPALNLIIQAGGDL
jgi:ankyrin repeat protein